MCIFSVDGNWSGLRVSNMTEVQITPLEAQRAALDAAGLAEADWPFLLHQPESRTGLLMLHGSAASPCNHRALAQQLFGLGYTALAPILAGHDQPQNLDHTSWLDCYQSAEQALTWLSPLVDRVFVIGSSFGGTLAYLLGIEHPELAGVIALSAPSLTSERWQPSSAWMTQVKEATAAAEYHLPRLTLPTLIMHGQDDTHVTVKNAWAAYERIPARRKKLVLYDGIGHALGFGYNTAEVAADIRHFIDHTYSPSRLTFTVQDQGYEQVHLAGEFNGWNGHSLPLYRKAGHWACEVELQPGAYQYKLVINGSDWILDPEAESVPTPHGERNSIFRVK